MIQIIITGKDKDMAKAWLDLLIDQAIGRKLDAIAKTLAEQGKLLMATKAEVKADLDAILVKVAATKGAVDSAVALLTSVLGQVQTAAATATDLDSFRTDLATIMTGTQAAGDELRAAVAANPVNPTA